MRLKKKPNKLQRVKSSRREQAAQNEKKRATKLDATKLDTSPTDATKTNKTQTDAVKRIDILSQAEAVKPAVDLANVNADSVTRTDLAEAARILKSASSKKRERRLAAAVMSLTGGSKRGGENRAKNLSPEQRREIARQGGLARQQKAREEDERLGFTLPRNKTLTRREIRLKAESTTNEPRA